jgi:hypothetical protein
MWDTTRRLRQQNICCQRAVRLAPGERPVLGSWPTTASPVSASPGVQSLWAGSSRVCWARAKRADTNGSTQPRPDIHATVARASVQAAASSRWGLCPDRSPEKNDSGIAPRGGDRAAQPVHACCIVRYRRAARRLDCTVLTTSNPPRVSSVLGGSKFLNWSSVRASVSARVLCMPIAGHASHQPRNFVLSESS